jgi:photosystem II stability/assembly factor-like uncharacterized protein
MPNTYQDVLTTKHGRPWAQFGGSKATNPLYYYGGNTSFFTITGVSNPVRGGISRINAHDPEQVGAYVSIGTQIDPPDYPEATFMFHDKKGSLPRSALARNCYFTGYLLHGECKSLSDFDYGWDGYLEVYENGLITEDNLGDRFTLDSDDPIGAERTMIMDRIYFVGGIQMAERIAATITREVTDITYVNKQTCGNCGPANDGAQWAYAVETGAAGAAPIVYYTTDGGATWATSLVTIAANAEAVAAIRVMGNYVVIVAPIGQSATNGSLYYSQINPVTGVPGAWAEATTGFTNNRQPRDMVVFGPREAYICCDGGEVLRVTDPPSGAVSMGVFSANNLLRIAGSSRDNLLVACGASGTVLKSLNRGYSFSAVAAAPAGTLQALDVLDPLTFWVGDSTGGVSVTYNGGDTTWSTRSLPLTATGIQDIKFATASVGYIACTVTGPLGRILVTCNGGQSWVPSTNVNPRISGLPATLLQRYNRLAYPGVYDGNIAANYLAAAALNATTDGAILLGSANVF